MSRGKRSKKKNRTMLDLQVVTLIIASILLTILIYTKAGYIGQTLSPILGGIMGWIKYIIPVGTFAIAIFLACDEDKDNFMKKILQYAVFLLCITTIITVIQISQGKLSTANGFEEAIKQAYYNGSKNIGGGAVGAICAIGLINLVGKIGTVIIAIGIAIIDSIFLFGIKPAELLKEYIETRNEKKQEAKAQRIEQRKLRADKEVIPKEKEEKKKKSKIMPEDNIVTEDQINIKMANNNEEQTSLFKKQEEIKEDKSKEILTLEHALTVEDENYEFPPVEFLTPGKTATKMGKKAVTDTANKLQKTLYSFGVSAKVENVSVGPTITRYELKPAEGVRVSKIANLADDIALSLAAETIRIEAPIPGKQAVGIEVPNKEKEVVHFREILDSDEFKSNKSKLTVGLGKDVAGNVQLADIGKMPHVLIAGSTGSGKSVCINTIITSIIYNAKPSEVKFVMVDPKVVELSVYNGIPHLLIPVVTDPRKAAGALAWAVQEMDDRYNKFASKGVRDLKGYNKAIEKENEAGKLPQIVIIIDELADLMMVAKNDVEDAICRLAQKARAAGMHLVIATQRPSVDVITGLIKANVPSRIAFAVSSQVDSRTILDSVGAEKLLGKGDMLFFPSGAPKPSRIQGAFVSDDEVEKIVDFIKSNGTATYSEDILESIENSNKSDKELAAEQAEDDDTDPFLMDAIQTVVETGQASTSFIQRRFKVGYARAGRIIDQMEERGVISGYQGSKPREVLMTLERLNELKMSTKEET